MERKNSALLQRRPSLIPVSLLGKYFDFLRGNMLATQKKVNTNVQAEVKTTVAKSNIAIVHTFFEMGHPNLRPIHVSHPKLPMKLPSETRHEQILQPHKVGFGIPEG